MKSKELIKRLQEIDPSGETEVCVGNVDIHFVDILPAYYDGTLQVLQRDPERKGYYDIIGGKYVRNGHKIEINCLSISDCIAEDPENFIIDYSALSEKQAETTKKAHDELRQASRDIDTKIEREYFKKWVMAKAETFTCDSIQIEDAVYKFFDIGKNISPKDPISNNNGYSYIKMRELQWDEKFEVIIKDGWLEIQTKERCQSGLMGPP